LNGHLLPGEINMLHNWYYKKIGNLSQHLWEKAKCVCEKSQYVSLTPNVNVMAKNYSFGGKLYTSLDSIEVKLLYKDMIHYLYNFFKPDGHLGTNIARLGPRTYIKEHSDFNNSNSTEFQLTTIKLQIPIITNDKNALMWATVPSESEIGIFETGGIYIIDNIKPHSVVNLSNDNRYWITSRWKLSSILDTKLLD
jgi:hypothetical protein